MHKVNKRNRPLRFSPQNREPAQILPVGYPPPGPEQVDEKQNGRRPDDAEENNGCRREVSEHDLADDRQAGEQDLDQEEQDMHADLHRRTFD